MLLSPSPGGWLGRQSVAQSPARTMLLPGVPWEVLWAGLQWQKRREKWTRTRSRSCVSPISGKAFRNVLRRERDTERCQGQPAGQQPCQGGRCKGGAQGSSGGLCRSRATQEQCGRWPWSRLPAQQGLMLATDACPTLGSVAPGWLLPAQGKKLLPGALIFWGLGSLGRCSPLRGSSLWPPCQGPLLVAVPCANPDTEAPRER